MRDQIKHVKHSPRVEGEKNAMLLSTSFVGFQLYAFSLIMSDG